ncbi:MAG: hypothetical protein HY881_25790 [Deltaproteobacteria bacterium]|nr:hypothetical protein [Deltaproteobacteria bacterium]
MDYLHPTATCHLIKLANWQIGERTVFSSFRRIAEPGKRRVTIIKMV